MRHLSTFTGIGGIDLAGELAGMTTVGQVEIDKQARSVLRRHWPDVPKHEDITDGAVEFVRGLGGFDILSGGSPCFPAGTLVLCERGQVPIEDVVVGDRVFTHLHSWEPVQKVFRRTAQTVTVKGYGHPGLRCTADHRFWIRERQRKWRSNPRGWDVCWSDPEWVNAIDLKGKHWASPAKFPDSDAPPINGDGNDVPLGELTNELAWLVGAWLGNGWTCWPKHKHGTAARVFLCDGHHKGDEIPKRIEQAGLHFCESSERTVRKFSIGSRAFASWLDEHFGKGASEKRLPSWVFGLPRAMRQAILDGYLWTDGSQRGREMRATTVSKQLAIGIKLMAQTLGYCCTLYYYEIERDCIIEGRKVNERPQWQVVIYNHSRSASIADGNAWGLVRKVDVSKRKETVYDIQVGTAQSFLADGIFVHNCQGFSVAGRREGLDDDRSGLVLAFLRLVAEFTPAWVLIENVPGLLSSERGEDLAAVLGEWTGFRPAVPDGGWRNSGVCIGPRYAVAWRVLDAQFAGVPQRRRRVFLVGRARNAGRPDLPAKVLFEPESLCGNSPPRREAGAEVAGTLEAGSSGLGWRIGADEAAAWHIVPKAFGGNNTQGPIDVPTCLNAHGGPHGRQDFESETFAVCYTPEQGGSCRDCGEVASLITGNGDRVSNGTPFIAEPMAIRTANFSAYGIGVSEGTSYALDDAPRQAVCEPVPIDMRQASRGAKMTNHRRDGSSGGAPGTGIGCSGDPSPTLAGSHTPAVCEPYTIEVRGRDGECNLEYRDDGTANALRGASGGRGGTGVGAVAFKPSHYTRDKDGAPSEVVPPLSADADKGDQEAICFTQNCSGYQVRRLTPRECERLQGLPDNWTRYADDGRELSDGPRYRMLGNSVAIPCVEWIMRRIMAAEAGEL